MYFESILVFSYRLLYFCSAYNIDVFSLALAPLRQELASLPVEQLILIFRRFLEVDEKMNDLSIPNFFSSLMLKKKLKIVRLSVSLCMMRKIFTRYNLALECEKRLNTK